MYCPNCGSSQQSYQQLTQTLMPTRLNCSVCFKQFKLQECIPVTLSELIADVKIGKPITAIKKVRDELGLGLKDAKDIVDVLRKLYGPALVNQPDDPPHYDKY